MIDLLAARKAAGLSQMDLARKAGVDQRMISSLELHKMNMPADFATKVAPVLGVRADHLLNNQAMSRCFKLRDDAAAAIKSRPGAAVDELSTLVDELAVVAKADPGPVGAWARRALVGIQSALKADGATKSKPDYGGRDVTGRKVKGKANERDGVGRVRKGEV